MCPNCQSNNTQNRGSRRGIKRYFCKDFKTSFISKRRPKQLQSSIFKEYFLQRQTLQ
ncbi:transposase-like zinc-binding domain-containing protein [Sulfurimonas sp.]|uniref:IS1/IS1595 family N-terminal zinc-binding domain-containing protein n=1 Tax=Sulfurimonas sp. TaxID=2022749 RepID=UPI0039E6F717